jgi:hypothetical protein
MKLIIPEHEVREAVVKWLKEKYGVEATPNNLQPLTETQGQYEDATTYQIGYSMDGVVLECGTCGQKKP